MTITRPIQFTFYKSQAVTTATSYPRNERSIILKAGSFFLNDKKITIKKGDNLKSIVEKINKHLPYIKLKSRIVENEKGYRLRLDSKNKDIEIQDKEGVLAKLYNKGLIGKSSKHLIQITGGEIFYNRSKKSSRKSLDLLKTIIPQNVELSNNFLVLNELSSNIPEGFVEGSEEYSVGSIPTIEEMDLLSEEEIQSPTIEEMKETFSKLLLDGALQNVIEEKGLINTNLENIMYDGLFSSLKNSLATRFTLDELQNDALTKNGEKITERLIRNLNRHRDFSPILKRLKIDDDKIDRIANRIINAW